MKPTTKDVISFLEDVQSNFAGLDDDSEAIQAIQETIDILKDLNL